MRRKNKVLIGLLLVVALLAGLAYAQVGATSTVIERCQDADGGAHRCIIEDLDERIMMLEYLHANTPDCPGKSERGAR